jgi:hypothetical protein
MVLMIEDTKIATDQEAKNTTKPDQNGETKQTSKNNKKYVLIGAACLIGLIIIGGIVHAVTKKHTPNYHSSGDSQAQQAPANAALDTAVLPFKNSVSDGSLYALTDSQKYTVEFTAWGAHSLPHAGGHVEGNNKSNFRVHIAPSGKSVNITTGSTSCNTTTDLCGVTATDAKANTIWYTAESKGMKLIAIEHLTNQDLSPYLPGEGTQWRLYFSFDGGLDLNLQHTGEVSPELLQLIHVSGQDSILEATGYTKLGKPVDVALGTKLARPQIIAVQSKQMNGSTFYQADAQTEWSITPTMQTSKDQTCQWKYFTSDIQKQMQTVMDNELTHPQTYGLFSGSGSSAAVGVEGASEGSLCASNTIAYDNYSKISSNDSFGYYQINDAAKASGEVMAVYPINKTTAGYQTNKASFVSSADFMFRRGADVSGFANTKNFSFSLSQGAKTYTMRDLSGEVIDMPTAADTTSNDHFTARIDRGDNGGSAANMPIGKYVGVRYKIEKDKVVMQYGELADTASAVKLPATIPDAATCSGNYLCYIHDFSLLKP